MGDIGWDLIVEIVDELEQKPVLQSPVLDVWKCPYYLLLFQKLRISLFAKIVK